MTCLILIIQDPTTSLSVRTGKLKEHSISQEPVRLDTINPRFGDKNFLIYLSLNVPRNIYQIPLFKLFVRLGQRPKLWPKAEH